MRFSLMSFTRWALGRDGSGGTAVFLSNQIFTVVNGGPSGFCSSSKGSKTMLLHCHFCLLLKCRLLTMWLENS